MIESENVTMYVDFTHLTSFEHQDPDFITNIVTHFNKYEPDLRRGLTKFMNKYGGDQQAVSGQKKQFFALAVHQLP